jgi:hypothetical protein
MILKERFQKPIWVLSTSQILGILLGFTLSAMATSDTGLLDRIEGYYVSPSKYCSEFDEGKYKPCDPPTVDCLVIKKLDDYHVKFSVSSTQANGSTCAVEGVAELDGNRLKFIQHNKEDTLSFGKGIFIMFDHGQIEFKYQKQPETGTQPPFCGMQARLDRIRFSLSNKEKFNNQMCAG